MASAAACGSVSFDGNFRSRLWTWEEARDFCTMCLPYVDVLFGIEPYHLWKDENDHDKGDVKDDIPYQPDLEQQDMVNQAFVKKYPNIKCIARHVRYAHSGSENSLKAYLWYDGKTYESHHSIYGNAKIGGPKVGEMVTIRINPFEPTELFDHLAETALQYYITSCVLLGILVWMMTFGQVIMRIAG
jgi:2-dehydro-3-deoxygluconokinase